MLPNSSPTILVVDDDPGSLQALAAALRDWSAEHGCAIITASSAQQALQQVLSHDFAVILLNAALAAKESYDMVQALRQRPRAAETPIIFVDTLGLDEDLRLQAYLQGAADYLFPPLIQPVLIAKVAIFVALARKNLELKRQAEELITINNRLEIEIKERQLAVQQNKAKDEFLAMLGHELRNPLSAITSAASVLGFPGASQDKMQRARLIIQRQSQHLSHIVDDLLDLSRVMSRKIMLSVVEQDLAAILESSLETLRSTGRLEAYQLELDCSSAWVEADTTRMEQVITNLLDNAIKYTPSGGRIVIRLRQEAGCAILEISDNGIGMGPELLPHVFEVFVQGEHALDRTQGGLGIGLALVQQLVNLHGGTVSADSAGQGQGSRFQVRLPLASSIASHLREIEAGALERSYTILLVEDNADGREMTSAMLSAYGHQVFAVADGPAGLALVQQQQPDIALIDIGLPGMDGYQLAALLRASPDTARLKLIALTGYGEEKDQQRARQAGFDLHLVKPVSAENLSEAIRLCARLLL
jgi:signal transduction histidine kinase